MKDAGRVAPGKADCRLQEVLNGPDAAPPDLRVPRALLAAQLEGRIAVFCKVTPIIITVLIILAKLIVIILRKGLSFLEKPLREK